MYFSGTFTKPPSPLSLRCICLSQEDHWACQDSLSQLEGVWVSVSLHVTSFPDQSNNIGNIQYMYVMMMKILKLLELF